MKKLIADWTCGNIAVVASVEVPEGLTKGVETLVKNGITQLLQRKPSSNWEKAEADRLNLPGWEHEDEEGKVTLRRPKGFERNTIPFSDASVGNLRKEFGKAVQNLEGVSVGFAFSENTGGESAAMVGASQFVDLLLETKATEENLRNLVAALGMTNAKTADRSELIEFAHSKGLGQRSKK